MKSTNFTSLVHTADDVDAPKTSCIPMDTTLELYREEVVVDESDTDTDKAYIETQKVSIYKDHLNFR